MQGKAFFPISLATACAVAAAAISAKSDNLDSLGLPQLLGLRPGLNGWGIIVAQPEALAGPNEYEVNPSAASQTTEIFEWFNTNGNANNFPNSIGAESPHADEVAQHFYGASTGVAPGISHVDSSDADYFVAWLIDMLAPIDDQIVNQSFVFDGQDEEDIDYWYDYYVSEYGTVICSAVGNGGQVVPAGTAYNVIGVGAYALNAGTSCGPTPDGRCKPDLVAPESATSYSTPYVSGVAALLLQAVNEGLAGPNTAAASDRRTIKALLMNGAVKPYDWANTQSAPLDPRYGAGLLNVCYSYEQLAGGQHSFSAANASVWPMYTKPITAMQGWDFQTISTLAGQNVNHYSFNVTAGGTSTLTATTVWEIHAGASSINNLYLYLYNASNNALVAKSVSSLDNIQHLYVPKLPPGIYDLEVVSPFGLLSSETYALAYQFTPVVAPQLSLTQSKGSYTISWPATPTQYVLQQASSLAPPVNWTPVTSSVLLTNQTMTTTFNTGGATTGFFRLAR